MTLHSSRQINTAPKCSNAQSTATSVQNKHGRDILLGTEERELAGAGIRDHIEHWVPGEQSRERQAVLVLGSTWGGIDGNPDKN